MRTFTEQLDKNDKISLSGLSIVIDGAIEILIDGRPVEKKVEGDKIGYDLLFNDSHEIELRALEDHTVVAVLPLEELKKLYKSNEDIKKMADQKIKEMITELYEIYTSKKHFNFEQIIEKMVRTGNGSYTVLNVSRLCKEWGYSRQQFYRVVDNLEKKGITFNKDTKCFRKK